MKALLSDETRRFWRQSGEILIQFTKWCGIALLIGTIVGLAGTAFSYALKWASDTRASHPAMLYTLPLMGLIIVFLYRAAGRGHDAGTNRVIAAVRDEDSLGFAMAPLIFVGTVLTHLAGGSSGREGAALQLGGSLGNWIGRLLKLRKEEIQGVIMCGMSACFAAVFGTPLAAAVFSMEFINVGIMFYSGLVPCTIAGLVAVNIAGRLGVAGESLHIAFVPGFGPGTAVRIAMVAMICAAVSMFFCMILHEASHLGKKWLPNPYIRIAAAGAVIALLATLLRTTDYLGPGMHVVERALEGNAFGGAFALKILFTALTLGAGYKGGEIVPSFFVGATLGCTLGGLLGLSPSLCAAVGMIAVFCGVTNSPITALLIALELFGMEAAPYFLLGVGISYPLSGSISLYESQRIAHSKYTGVK